jgi:hypothetical protein
MPPAPRLFVLTGAAILSLFLLSRLLSFHRTTTLHTLYSDSIPGVSNALSQDPLLLHIQNNTLGVCLCG